MQANRESDREGVLSFEEAEARISMAVKEVEIAINAFNEVPGETDEARQRDLSSVFMALLAEKYTIMPPFDASKVSDDD